MKGLLLLLPLLFIAGCGGYGSMTEARAACSSWAYEGGRIKTARTANSKAYSKRIRGCKNEPTTRQVLGYDIPGAQAGTTYIRDTSGDYITDVYANENGHVLRDQRITKRFKY